MTAETLRAISFPRFNDLPKEIRLSIWEFAIPAPRLVEVIERDLATFPKDVVRQVDEWKAHPEELPQELKGTWKSDEEILERLELLAEQTPTWLGADELQMSEPLVNIFSPCRPPAMLFACRESNGVASKLYDRAFDTKDTALTFPQTYFDFDRDILYICWNTYHPDWTFKRLIYFLTHSFDPETRQRVKNLAILVKEHELEQFGFTIEWIVTHISNAFTGLKSLILVPRHVGNYLGRFYSNQTLILSEPFDTDSLEILAINHNPILAEVPMLKLDKIRVDWERLAARRMKLSPLDVGIQYKMVIPEEYGPFLDYMQERCTGNGPNLKSSDVEISVEGKALERNNSVLNVEGTVGGSNTILPRIS
jgi:hypothetical protein